MTKNKPHVIRNPRAIYDYDLADGLIVGIELTGKEAKALRLNHGQLNGAYVTVIDNQLWLVNSTIHSTTNITIEPQDQVRNRRLLASRRQINDLISAKNQGKTIVPLEIITKGRYIKLRIAAGRGKKRYDKRQIIRQRDIDRSNQRDLKSFR